VKTIAEYNIRYKTQDGESPYVQRVFTDDKSDYPYPLSASGFFLKTVNIPYRYPN